MYITRFSRILPLLALFALCLASSDWIIFPHNIHIEDTELTCAYCHEAITSGTSLQEQTLPRMDFCGECHDVDDDCSLCHAEPDDADTYAVEGSTSGLDFNHAAHLMLNENCDRCHSEIALDDGLSQRLDWPQSNCDDCHSSSKPLNHDAYWPQIHGLEIDLPPATDCSLCHTEKFCDDCHHLPRFGDTVHPAAYLLTHGFDVRMNTYDCGTCHDIVVDCQDCHRRQMIIPADHNQLDWALKSGMGGGLHTDAAEDTPEVCAACHSGPTCIRCHGED